MKTQLLKAVHTVEKENWGTSYVTKSTFLKEKCLFFLRRLERQNIRPELNLGENPEWLRDKESHHSESRISTLSSPV